MTKQADKERETSHNDYKKVRLEGGSTTVLSMGKLLPLDWKIVRLEVVEVVREKSVTVRIVKIA